ncbi:MAG: phosphodiester glycosidase family protein [Armatimonadota bacterium]
MIRSNLPAIPSKRRAAGAIAPAALCVVTLIVLLGAAGCSETPVDTVEVAPGISFHRDKRHGVQLLDIDLAVAKLRPIVVAEKVNNHHGNFVGNAKTVREWAEQFGAVGGINGGFFGDTYDQIGRRKQIVQLAVVDGKVIAPGSATRTKNGGIYTRSAVGFSANGRPDIVWGTGTAKLGPRRRSGPNSAEQSQPWNVEQAVACGPRLFASGVRRVTGREELLPSPGKPARAFVAFDHENGAPRHLVLGRADSMELTQVADYVATYFPDAHGTTPREAMCLDGGPSAQVVYRDPQSKAVTDAEPTGVMVPTAILLVPR